MMHHVMTVMHDHHMMGMPGACACNGGGQGERNGHNGHGFDKG